MNPDDGRTQRPPLHSDSVNPAMGGDDAGPDARGNDTSSGLQMPPDLMLDVLPLTLRLDHPRSFAFVPTAPTWPGVLADFIAAGYNINACTWLVASGPSQLELVVIDWFRRWLGYPEGAGGLFTSGGSAASLDAFVAAREAAGHPERGTVYMSDQSHTAFLRAAIIAGIRRECIRKVPTDRHFRLDMNAPIP